MIMKPHPPMQVGEPRTTLECPNRAFRLRLGCIYVFSIGFPLRFLGFSIFSLHFSSFSYFETSNNRTGGAHNEYRGGPGGPGTGFCSPGGGFLVLVAVVACHYVHYH